MNAPRLPWSHEFDWHEHQHSGSVFDIDDPAAPWHGAYEQGANISDQALERLVHAVVAPGAGYDRPGAELPTVGARMADIQEANRNVSNVIDDIRSAQKAYNASKPLASAAAKGWQSHEEPFRVNWTPIAMDLAKVAYTTGEVAATLEALPEVAALIGVEYAAHEAHIVYDMMPGNPTQKAVNVWFAAHGANRPILANEGARYAPQSANPVVRAVQDAGHAAAHAANVVTSGIDKARSWVASHMPGHH
jgi:hypothetical protein